MQIGYFRRSGSGYYRTYSLSNDGVNMLLPTGERMAPTALLLALATEASSNGRRFAALEEGCLAVVNIIVRLETYVALQGKREALR